MLKISSAIIISLLLSFNVMASQECQLIKDEKKDNQYSVINSTGIDVGYIALEPDGTWFVWIKNKGAINGSYTSQIDAKEKVCFHHQGF